MGIFGLTGNIGCGKSTVASLLSTCPNVYIHNTDEIAKSILADPKSLEIVRSILGSKVIHDGIVDRSAVARVIFGNSVKKRSFEAWMHPRVWETVYTQMSPSSYDDIHVVESAIIYEMGDVDRFSEIIVVTCDEEVQKERLRRNRKMSDEDIELRMDHQLPAAVKAARANFVIDTNCDQGTLLKNVLKLYRWLILANLEASK